VRGAAGNRCPYRDPSRLKGGSRASFARLDKLKHVLLFRLGDHDDAVCRYIVQHPFAPRPKCTRESLDDAYPTLVVTWLCCSKPSAVVRRILAPIAMPLLTEPESFRCG
jgi:hypothetical protein